MTLLDAFLLGRKIQKAKKKLEDFKKNEIRRDPGENLNAELWYPDLKDFRCINDPKFTPERGNTYARLMFFENYIHSDYYRNHPSLENSM